jgi:hypothetical protein
MALSKDSTGYYLEPTTGQYYTTYTLPSYSYSPFGGGMGIGMSGMGGWSNQYQYQPQPEGLITVGNQMYKPFSGNAAGISQGKRSVVDSMIGSRQPYEYNVPTLAELFPSMQGAMQPATMPQGNQFQGGSGAGRFMGGLLGAMPTPVSTTTTQAPSSSGAGRFL